MQRRNHRVAPDLPVSPCAADSRPPARMTSSHAANLEAELGRLSADQPAADCRERPAQAAEDSSRTRNGDDRHGAAESDRRGTELHTRDRSESENEGDDQTAGSRACIANGGPLARLPARCCPAGVSRPRSYFLLQCISEGNTFSPLPLNFLLYSVRISGFSTHSSLSCCV